MGLLLLPIMLGLMYVLLVLPQQRRVKAHQALVSALDVGDEVMTTAGLYGRITGFDGDIAHLEVADGVEVRVARGAIGKRVEPVAATPDAAPAAVAADDPPELGEGADEAEAR
ncbi:MAG: preprotein translocase subunit YajC [Acidimicrobiales bacterium]|nr:preprotein translocase subunit YajC [Acidimicrobiales bacterium]